MRLTKSKPHVNVGTMGHVDHGRLRWLRLLQCWQSAASAVNKPVAYDQIDNTQREVTMVLLSRLRKLWIKRIVTMHTLRHARTTTSRTHDHRCAAQVDGAVLRWRLMFRESTFCLQSSLLPRSLSSWYKIGMATKEMVRSWWSKKKFANSAWKRAENFDKNPLNHQGFLRSCECLKVTRNHERYYGVVDAMDSYIPEPARDMEQTIHYTNWGCLLN